MAANLFIGNKPYARERRVGRKSIISVFMDLLHLLILRGLQGSVIVKNLLNIMTVLAVCTVPEND